MPDKNTSRTVYTTEAGRICPNCQQPIASCRCKKSTHRPQGDGILRVSLEKKGRGGKTVSIITGFSGSDDQLKSLASELKRRCGTGGTLKDGAIEIQGDHRDVLVAILKEKGFQAKRVGG